MPYTGHTARFMLCTSIWIMFKIKRLGLELVWSAACSMSGHVENGQNDRRVGRRGARRGRCAGGSAAGLRAEGADRALLLLQPRQPEDRRAEERAVPGRDPGPARPARVGPRRVLPVRDGAGA